MPNGANEVSYSISQIKNRMWITQRRELLKSQLGIFRAYEMIMLGPSSGFCEDHTEKLPNHCAIESKGLGFHCGCLHLLDDAELIFLLQPQTMRNVKQFLVRPFGKTGFRCSGAGCRPPSLTTSFQASQLPSFGTGGPKPLCFTCVYQIAAMHLKNRKPTPKP